jgi:ribonuclease P/MRP protein subunit RPP1
VAHLLNGTVSGMKSFDIIAVAPATEKLWAMACEKMDVDIIALDLSQRLPFFVKPKQVELAIGRGVYFEIGYSGAIVDATARRNLISNAIQLVRASRGRHVVISSKAERAILARGPCVDARPYH